MRRGGQSVFKDMPGELHVRIEASEDARSQRIQKEQDVSLKEAEKIVAKRDKAAEFHLKRFYEIGWSNPLHYHLVINTGKWDTEAAAHLGRQAPRPPRDGRRRPPPRRDPVLQVAPFRPVLGQIGRAHV